MAFLPRMLHISDEEEARREICLIGADPVGVDRMAGKMVPAMVKLTGIACRCANILKQEMLAIGGDAAVARGSVACSIDKTDTILIGSRKQLHLLGRRLRSQPFGLESLGRELESLLQTMDNPPSVIKGRSCSLDLTHPIIMGVLNVTPDSFSDGGRFVTVESAVRQAEVLIGQGADLVDVGGESTRPGAAKVEDQEELNRVVPVVEALKREFGVPVSVDTTKSSVAGAALEAGAAFVNDISGMRFDPLMARTIAARDGGVFLMHTRGRPDSMQKDTRYGDLMGEIISYLHECVQDALAAGIARDHIAIDPGIGFGKDLGGNLEVLRRLGELRTLGLPILLGTSRKNFIGRILAQPDPQQRLMGTMATVSLGVGQGATLFRVHDVEAARQTAQMAWAICRSRGNVKD